MEITDFAVSTSLKLAEMFMERLSLRNDIGPICLAIKLLFLSIQKSGNGEENKQQERQSMVEGATGHLLKKLETALRVEFHCHMQEYYHSEPLLRELQVRIELFYYYNNLLTLLESFIFYRYQLYVALPDSSYFVLSKEFNRTAR